MHQVIDVMQQNKVPIKQALANAFRHEQQQQSQLTQPTQQQRISIHDAVHIVHRALQVMNHEFLFTESYSLTHWDRTRNVCDSLKTIKTAALRVDRLTTLAQIVLWNRR
jgi:hypothetical protein